ncbi:MAG: DUF3368 domain-containing protein [Opitutus sp.]|nr:DUF3368 domain-containing protein [Opitutus sp.]
MTVVSNASPLISLARVGHLSLLPALFDEVQIAAEVYHEVAVAGAGRPAALAVQNAPWLRIQSCSNPALLEQWRTRYSSLGRGELATILLAQSIAANWTIIDERAARRLAAAQGLRIIGCIGIFEAAFRRGLVSDLHGVYGDLVTQGIRVHPEILNRSLVSLGLSPLSQR